MKTKGSRAGAILKADAKTVHLIGYGVYVGDEIPPENVGGFNLAIPNPKIELDNGKFVFGCECWWATEDEVIKMVGFRKVVDVDIDKHRSDHATEQVKE